MTTKLDKNVREIIAQLCRFCGAACKLVLILDKPHRKA